jgi:hypothetical protein
MNWIVLVLIACSGSDCSVVEAEAKMVSDAREEAIRKNCDAAPNCFEMRRGFFIIRQVPPATPPTAPSPTPGPIAPPSPSLPSARAPGSRA